MKRRSFLQFLGLAPAAAVAPSAAEKFEQVAKAIEPALAVPVYTDRELADFDPDDCCTVSCATSATMVTFIHVRGR